MLAYLRFDARRQVRNWVPPSVAVLLPVALYVLFSQQSAGSLRVEGAAITGDAYRMVALAGLGTVLGVLSMSSGASEERDAGWLQQLRTTPLPPSRVLLAKGAVSTTIALLTAVAVSLAAVVVDGVELPAGRWIAVVVLLWLGAIPFALLGLGIGYALRPQHAHAATMLGFLALTVLGGQMTTVETFPEWLQHVSRMTPSYRYGELGWRAVDGLWPTPLGAAVLLGWTVVIGALATWSYRRFTAVR